MLIRIRNWLNLAGPGSVCEIKPEEIDSDKLGGVVIEMGECHTEIYSLAKYHKKVGDVRVGKR